MQYEPQRRAHTGYTENLNFTKEKVVKFNTFEESHAIEMDVVEMNDITENCEYIETIRTCQIETSVPPPEYPSSNTEIYDVPTVSTSVAEGVFRNKQNLDSVGYRDREVRNCASVIKLEDILSRNLEDTGKMRIPISSEAIRQKHIPDNNVLEEFEYHDIPSTNLPYIDSVKPLPSCLKRQSEMKPFEVEQTKAHPLVTQSLSHLHYSSLPQINSSKPAGLLKPRNEPVENLYMMNNYFTEEVTEERTVPEKPAGKQSVISKPNIYMPKDKFNATSSYNDLYTVKIEEEITIEDYDHKPRVIEPTYPMPQKQNQHIPLLTQSSYQTAFQKQPFLNEVKEMMPEKHKINPVTPEKHNTIGQGAWDFLPTVGREMPRKLNNISHPAVSTHAKDYQPHIIENPIDPLILNPPRHTDIPFEGVSTMKGQYQYYETIEPEYKAMPERTPMVYEEALRSTAATDYTQKEIEQNEVRHLGIPKRNFTDKLSTESKSSYIKHDYGIRSVLEPPKPRNEAEIILPPKPKIDKRDFQTSGVMPAIALQSQYEPFIESTMPNTVPFTCTTEASEAYDAKQLTTLEPWNEKNLLTNMPFLGTTECRDAFVEPLVKHLASEPFVQEPLMRQKFQEVTENQAMFKSHTIQNPLPSYKDPTPYLKEQFKGESESRSKYGHKKLAPALEPYINRVITGDNIDYTTTSSSVYVKHPNAPIEKKYLWAQEESEDSESSTDYNKRSLADGRNFMTSTHSHFTKHELPLKEDQPYLPNLTKLPFQGSSTYSTSHRGLAGNLYDQVPEAMNTFKQNRSKLPFEDHGKSSNVIGAKTGDGIPEEFMSPKALPVYKKPTGSYVTTSNIALPGHEIDTTEMNRKPLPGKRKTDIFGNWITTNKTDFIDHKSIIDITEENKYVPRAFPDESRDFLTEASTLYKRDFFDQSEAAGKFAKHQPIQSGYIQYGEAKFPEQNQMKNPSLHMENRDFTRSNAHVYEPEWVNNPQFSPGVEAIHLPSNPLNVWKGNNYPAHKIQEDIRQGLPIQSDEVLPRQWQTSNKMLPQNGQMTEQPLRDVETRDTTKGQWTTSNYMNNLEYRDPTDQSHLETKKLYTGPRNNVQNKIHAWPGLNENSMGSSVNAVRDSYNKSQWTTTTQSDYTLKKPDQNIANSRLNPGQTYHISDLGHLQVGTVQQGVQGYSYPNEVDKSHLGLYEPEYGYGLETRDNPNMNQTITTPYAIEDIEDNRGTIPRAGGVKSAMETAKLQDAGELERYQIEFANNTISLYDDYNTGMENYFEGGIVPFNVNEASTVLNDYHQQRVFNEDYLLDTSARDPIYSVNYDEVYDYGAGDATYDESFYEQRVIDETVEYVEEYGDENSAEPGTDANLKAAYEAGIDVSSWSAERGYWDDIYQVWVYYDENYDCYVYYDLFQKDLFYWDNDENCYVSQFSGAKTQSTLYEDYKANQQDVLPAKEQTKWAKSTIQDHRGGYNEATSSETAFFAPNQSQGRIMKPSDEQTKSVHQIPSPAGMQGYDESRPHIDECSIYLSQNNPTRNAPLAVETRWTNNQNNEPYDIQQIDEITKIEYNEYLAKNNYQDNSAYNNQSNYQDTSAYYDQSNYQDTSAYNNQSNYQDNSAYNNQSNYQDNSAYNNQSNYQDNSAYYDQSNYQDNSAYYDQRNYQDTSAYNNQSNYQDNSAYNNQSNYKNGSQQPEDPELSEYDQYLIDYQNKNSCVMLPSGIPAIPALIPSEIKPRHKHQTLVRSVHGIYCHPTQQQIADAYNSDLSEVQNPSIESPIKHSKEKSELSVPWLKFADQVLQFSIRFHDTTLENEFQHIIRYCRLVYYVYDGTCQIDESSTANSGFAQGVFLSRRRLEMVESPDGIPTTSSRCKTFQERVESENVVKTGPLRFKTSLSHDLEKDTGDVDQKRYENIPWQDPKYLNPSNIKLGSYIRILERVTLILDSDDTTKEFYKKHNLDIGTPQLEAMCQEHPAEQTDFKVRNEIYENQKYVEKSLGGNSSSDLYTLSKQRPDVTLTFFATSPPCQGTDKKQYYIIKSYVMDDTISINIAEMLDAQGVPKNWIAFLKRNKVPKERESLSIIDIGTKQEDLITWRDLIVGKSIQIYKRNFTLYDCCDITKEFYKNRHIIQNCQPLELKVQKEYPRVIPPYYGIGGDEDSAISCKYLIPKPVTTDLKKLFAEADNVLSFEAKKSKEDMYSEGDRFTIKYFMDTDQTMVAYRPSENNGKNPGVIARKEKRKNPITESYFLPSEFYVGAKITINAVTYELINSDESTLEYCESKPSVFPYSNISSIVSQAIACLGDEHLLTCTNINEVLMSHGVELNSHELLTLNRAIKVIRQENICPSEYLSLVI